MSETSALNLRLHPGTMIILWVTEAPQRVIGIPALAAITGRSFSTVIFLAALLAVLALIIGAVRWYRFQYGIGDGEIVIESGIFSRNRRTIPFSRIQDVDIEQKLLHRVFGLAKVKVESGGGGKDEGSLDSVSIEQANAIRKAVRAANSGPSVASVNAEAAASSSSPLIYSLSPGQLLKFGLFSYSFSSLAAVGAGLWYAYNKLDDFVGKPKDIIKRAEGYVPDHFDGLWLLWGAFFLLLLAGLTSIARVVRREYDFRLTREERGLRRTRGLFTHSEIMIPTRRVKLALLETSLVWNRFGYSSLALQTLGGGEHSSGHQAVAPFATRGELDPILAELPGLAVPDNLPLAAVSARHPLHMSLGLALIMLGGLAVSWFFPLALLGTAPFAFILPVTWLSARRHSYAVSDTMLFVRKGYWKRALWIVPLASVECVTVQRDWLQRKLGLATLLIDTAGAAAMSDPRIIDLHSEIAYRIAAHIIERARHLRKH